MMKFALTFLALAVVVIAEDVFFYEHSTGQVVHRLQDRCIIVQLDDDELPQIHDETFRQNLQEMVSNMTDMATMATGEQSAWVQNHCHNRELYVLSDA